MKLGDFAKHSLILEPEFTVGQSIDLMETSFVQELPLVDSKYFQSVVQLDKLKLLEKLHEKLKNIPNLGVHTPTFLQHQSPIECLGALIHCNQQMAVVLDRLKLFDGYILKTELEKVVADFQIFESFGAIVVLEFNINSSSITKICSIIEQSDLKVMGLSFPKDKEEVWVKVSSSYTDRLVSNLERYEINVLDVLNNLEDQSNQDKYNSIFKFLEF